MGRNGGIVSNICLWEHIKNLFYRKTQHYVKHCNWIRTAITILGKMFIIMKHNLMFSFPFQFKFKTAKVNLINLSIATDKLERWQSQDISR